MNKVFNLSALALLAAFASCQGQATKDESKASTKEAQAPKKKYLAEPLIRDIFTADPSAHVFNGKIYIYPSHDIEAGIAQNDNGDHFAMKDYHILSMDD